MRIKIIMRLFMNPSRQAYLRELSWEFGASPSHIKDELDQLTEANLLVNTKSGRQVLFSANIKHPVFKELHSMVSKALGINHILESIIIHLGNLEKAFLIDDYAEGKDTGIIDLVLIGHIDQSNLHDSTNKTEKYLYRKIRTLVFTSDEYDGINEVFSMHTKLLLWEKRWKIRSNAFLEI